MKDEFVISSYGDPDEMVDILSAFTDAYCLYTPEGPAIREAMCLKVQWKGRVRPIRENDLFAGRMGQNPIGFIGQSDESSMGYYLHHEAVSSLLNDPQLSPESKQKLKDLIHFWEKENTVAKAKNTFPEEMKSILPSDFYYRESGIAFTLWRMAGIQLDYGKLISLGIPGLKTEILEKENASSSIEAKKLYQAMGIALDTFTDICLFYADQAEWQAAKVHPVQKKELLEMARILRYITRHKPQTFREGLQLHYLYTMVDGARNYGRMDDALGDLYAADIDSGHIDFEEAIRLLTGIWSLINDRHYRYDSRVVMGGKGRTNEKNADRLALAIMETSSRVREIVPQLALRFYKGQNPELYRKALDILGSGYTFPMLYNDDVNIPSVQKAFDVPYEEAIHAIQYGCGEYVLNHRSVGTPSGVINLLQALLVTLFKGKDPLTGKAMGLPSERYSAYNDFLTFEDLFKAYKDQVEYHVVQLAKHEELEYSFAGKENAYLYTSMLMDDCLERGKSIFDGGIRYLGGTLEVYGNSNTADSLTAIKEQVYEKKNIRLETLREMLLSNFQGFEKERKLLLSSPKYGNDNDTADQMLVEVHNHICHFTRKQKDNTNLHSYLVVVINNDANTVMGTFTAASPDGRLAKTYMNPGNNPVGGADKSGLTAFLNSLLKPGTAIHAGAVQNMKFSKEMFTVNKHHLETVLSTWFSLGGSQAMLTVINRRDLEEAVLHPEKYQNLIVRVGGFSERFVNLPPETQQEILSRTLY